MAFQTIETIDRALFLSQETIEVWATIEVMQDIITDDPDGRMSDTLGTLQEKYGLYAGLFCMNQAGQIMAASHPASINRDVSTETWFQDALQTQTVSISDVAFDESTQAYLVQDNAKRIACLSETVSDVARAQLRVSRAGFRAEVNTSAPTKLCR